MDSGIRSGQDILRLGLWVRKVQDWPGVPVMVWVRMVKKVVTRALEILYKEMDIFHGVLPVTAIFKMWIPAFCVLTRWAQDEF